MHGVAKSADAAELKKAYRRLAMKHHPDRNPDDATAEAKFKDAKEAYEVLKDPKKKALYDQYGHAGLSGGGGGGRSHGYGGGAGADGFGDIFGDIFSDIFGQGGQGGGGRQSRRRGNDIAYRLDLNLEDAVKGKTVEIQVPTQRNCNSCEGSGAKKGTKPSKCQTCAGMGQVRMSQGFFSVQQACPNCQGTGE
eukprot:maker-scaffold3_size1495701-snap-gene-5.0 protein:Tk07946 transcript:maker-scaffold3_size1495701-snap-gene-5.0-mRNA-1 annotation:"molecular chaperone"